MKKPKSNEVTQKNRRCEKTAATAPGIALSSDAIDASDAGRAGIMQDKKRLLKNGPLIKRPELSDDDSLSPEARRAVCSLLRVLRALDKFAAANQSS